MASGPLTNGPRPIPEQAPAPGEPGVCGSNDPVCEEVAFAIMRPSGDAADAGGCPTRCGSPHARTAVPRGPPPTRTPGSRHRPAAVPRAHGVRQVACRGYRRVPRAARGGGWGLWSWCVRLEKAPTTYAAGVWPTAIGEALRANEAALELRTRTSHLTGPADHLDRRVLVGGIKLARVEAHP